MTRRRPWMLAPNAGDLVAETVTLDPERTVVIAGERDVRYGELDERARRVAGLLRAAGVRAGETVALALGNDWRFVETLLGTLRAGAVALLVNVKLGAETLGYIAEHSETRAIIADGRLGSKLSAMIEAAQTLRATLVTEPDAAVDDYEKALAAATPAGHSHPVDPDDLALLMYTSGSTGRPKGCMLSHSTTWWQARSTARTMLLDRADRGLVMGPLYHANALWGILLPMLFVGGSVVVLRDFDCRQALQAIHDHRVTFTSGTPSMYALLLGDPEISRFELSSLSLLQCGSAPVPEELMSRITAMFDCEVVETYGLTEAGANVLTPRWGVKKLGSTGLPVPDVEIRIARLDDPARDCGPGEVGELWSRSPANALGYLKEPELTTDRFTPDGWVRTGDLMRRDDQGYCYFCGRVDDMISVGGENVYPKEVETILLTHPAVANVGVVSVPHAVKGQAPVAFVVLKPGAEATEEELKAHFLARGPAYAHPRRVFFLDQMPISSTNKLDRGALERRANELLPQGVGPAVGDGVARAARRRGDLAVCVGDEEGREMTTRPAALFDLKQAAARLEQGSPTIEVAGQRIACAILFETSRSQAAVFRLRPGQRIPAHTHSAIDDIFFCLGGLGRIRTWDAGGVAHDHSIEPGTVFLVEPETPHEVSCAGGEFCYVLLQAPTERYDSHGYALPGSPS